MTALLVLMLVLALHSLTFSGAAEGLRFYLVPDFSKINGTVIVAAMNQAFFSLSVGMGGMAIFGSYIGKDRALMGESVHVILLDTFVAVLAGIIIFPACFTYGLEVTAGPSLLFDTMAGVFNHMAGGRWWGTLFFLFMVFAALSTVLGVCENILAMIRELTGWSRPKGCLVCGVGIFLLALTTALGYSVLHFQPFAPGSAWLDFWDFIVSNNVLPLGSLVLALFCCSRFGWGWDRFVAEANTGKGLKLRPWMKPRLSIFLSPAPSPLSMCTAWRPLPGGNAPKKPRRPISRVTGLCALFCQTAVFHRHQAELVVKRLGKFTLALIADTGRYVLHPQRCRAQQLGGLFQPAAAEIGKIPLAQHILAVQLEAALAQAEAIGQRLGRMPHREIAQHKRFGFTHQLDLPRGAAGGLGVIGQAQQLIQQPHRRVAQLARGGVLGIAPLLVQNVGDGLADRAAVDTVPAEVVRNTADLKAHHGQKAVRLHGVRVDEKLQPLILAARQVERLIRRSKADGGVCLCHDGVFLRPIGDGPPPGAAEVKDQQPRTCKAAAQGGCPAG